MSIAAYLAYAIALAIAAALPGPGVTALLARALAGGVSAAMPMLAGLIVGDLFFLTLAVLGLAFIAQTFAGTFLAVKIAGAIYLLYLAWRFWREGLSPVRLAGRSGREGRLAAFAGGLAVTLGNPKTVVFYLALVPGVVDLHAVGFADWAALSLITVAVLIVVMVPYAVLASQTRRSLGDRLSLKWLGRSASAIMAGTAGFILARG